MRPVPYAQSRRPADLHRASGVRFEIVRHLGDGRAIASEARLRAAFEDAASFGPAQPQGASPDAARWLAAQIGMIGKALEPALPRPILMPAPLAALANPNTALACDAAARAAEVRPQDLCLMFPDVAFAGDPADSTSRVAKLRRLGVRVGIDMRKSWQTALDEGLRLMLDTLRVDARHLETHPELAAATTVANAAGLRVIADGARWRDADILAQCGVTAAINPRSDS